jgi:hypothetical protein
MLALMVVAAAVSNLDPLWLRYQLVHDKARLDSYRSSIPQVAVEADVATCTSSIEQLHAAADELEEALEKLLGHHIPTTCCSSRESGKGPNRGLTVSIRRDSWPALGNEGFSIEADGLNGPAIHANTASAALYGSFRFLAYLQRAEPIPTNFTSVPAMTFRIFDLWDEVDGSITRGFSGESVVWPMALYDDAYPPPRAQLFLADCNETDIWQQWEGATLHSKDTKSTIRNKAANQCLTTLHADPMVIGSCAGPESAIFLYNHSNLSLAVQVPSAGGGGHRKAGACLDVNGGAGPGKQHASCAHLSLDIDLTCSS